MAFEPQTPAARGASFAAARVQEGDFETGAVRRGLREGQSIRTLVSRANGELQEPACFRLASVKNQAVGKGAPQLDRDLGLPGTVSTGRQLHRRSRASEEEGASA